MARGRRIALAAAAVASLAAPATALAIKPGTQPTAVGVAQREFSVTPYRRSVPVGAVKLNVRNFGEDVHNIVGTGTTWIVKLRRPGTYQLLCTRANHLKLGMRAKLTVVPDKKRR
jgi:plastocyanin